MVPRNILVFCLIICCAFTIADGKRGKGKGDSKKSKVAKEASRKPKHKVLATGDSSTKHDKLLNEFECPGLGKYAVENSTNCAKFFDCKKKGKRPAAISECKKPKKQAFNRLSRTCESKELVRCKWCQAEGRHADITSPNHFIECAPGNIAIRYKCKTGLYDSEEQKCQPKKPIKNTAGRSISSSSIGVEDKPKSISAFMKKWIKAELEKKDNSIEDSAKASKKKPAEAKKPTQAKSKTPDLSKENDAPLKHDNNTSGENDKNKPENDSQENASTPSTATTENNSTESDESKERSSSEKAVNNSNKNTESKEDTNSTERTESKDASLLGKAARKSKNNKNNKKGKNNKESAESKERSLSEKAVDNSNKNSKESDEDNNTTENINSKETKESVEDQKSGENKNSIEKKSLNSNLDPEESAEKEKEKRDVEENSEFQQIPDPDGESINHDDLNAGVQEPSDLLNFVKNQFGNTKNVFGNWTDTLASHNNAANHGKNSQADANADGASAKRKREEGAENDMGDSTPTPNSNEAVTKAGGSTDDEEESPMMDFISAQFGSQKNVFKKWNDTLASHKNAPNKPKKG